ncbi:MAG: winged helix-turn-helix transcriptional regulator, partial [bacterium]|nr:winged helix-turn-helix transcriptional regulator [bacterium]
MVLDPDDPKPPFQQVANHLRAAILTGEFGPGDQLPTGGQLSEMYGVARMTVQKALQILRDEDLIISRQGAGVYVKGRTTAPIGLRPHIESAFEAEDVTIDFVGFSGETLHGALIEPLDKVRSGRYVPQSIRVRALVPDTTEPWALPCNVEDLSDNPAFRQRAQSIITTHAGALVEATHELEQLGLVPSAVAEIRVVRSVQLLKLYLINGVEAFYGFYPIRQRAITIDDSEHNIFDLMGKDATLFHYERTNDEDDTSSRFVTEA